MANRPFDDNDPEIVDFGKSLEKISTVDRRKDTLREKIALRLTYAVIAITVVPILAAVAFPSSATAVKEVATSIIPVTVGIYGTVIGFYFGGDK